MSAHYGLSKGYFFEKIEGRRENKRYVNKGLDQ
jgi:hypothetical protein